MVYIIAIVGVILLLRQNHSEEHRRHEKYVKDEARRQRLINYLKH